MLRRESGSANGCLWAMASWDYRRAALHRRHCIIFLGEMNIPLGTVTAEKGRFKHVTPRKLRWQWKVTKGKYIFKWLVFHCHISFTGCISCYLQKTPIAICAARLFRLCVSVHVWVKNRGFPVNRKGSCCQGWNHFQKASKEMTLKNVTRCCFTCIKISAETPWSCKRSNWWCFFFDDVFN